jgi:hypothetical protein
MSGYRVILDVGMAGKEVEFPEANCWAFKDGYLKVGDGMRDSIGAFKGELHGSFNQSKVAGIVDM